MTLVVANEVKVEEKSVSANESPLKEIKEGSFETSKGKGKIVEEANSGYDDMNDWWIFGIFVKKVLNTHI